MQLGEPVTIDESEIVARMKVYTHPFPVKTHVFNYTTRSLKRPLEFNTVRLFNSNASGSETAAATPNSSNSIGEDSRMTMVCSLDKFGSHSFQETDMNQETTRYALTANPFKSRSNYLIGYICRQSLFLTPVHSVHSFATALASQQSGETVVPNAACTVEEKYSSKCTSDENVLSERTIREVSRQRSTILNKESAGGTEVHFYPSSSTRSTEFKKRFESINGLMLLPPPNLSKSSFVQMEDLFFPPEILSSGGITGGDENQNSIIRRFASVRSIKELVTDLMKRAQVLTFEKVKGIVESTRGSQVSTDAVILECLAASSVYMHGVWVCRRNSKFSGVGAAIREVVLAAFFNSPDGVVSRKELNSLSLSSAHRRLIKEVLESVSVLEGSTPGARQWRLLYVGTEPDTTKENVAAFLKAFGADIQYELVQKRMSQVQSHKTYIAANKTPPALFLSRGEEEARPVSNVPETGGGASGFDVDEIEAIKSYIDELFRRFGVLNKARAKEMILKGRDTHYPHATNPMLSSALQTTVTQFTANTWVLRNVGQPVVDEYRPHVLEVVSSMTAFKLADLQATLAEKAMSKVANIPQGVLKTIVEEVADYRLSERVYYVKTGSVMTEN
ncbi:hypothetical protein AGDE_10729 [Angomonas deanei]|nr:hypothetical protein AGDE_10729 [Angomonas deanei]|eukprot:EPY27512.1 hypothetical protein AGDE_10729 [Angomonas deanei]